MWVVIWTCGWRRDGSIRQVVQSGIVVLLLRRLLLWMRWMRLSDDVGTSLTLDWRWTLLLDVGFGLGRRRNGRSVLRCVSRLFWVGLMFGLGF